MEAELVALASSGATTLVALRVTDGWERARERFGTPLRSVAAHGYCGAHEAGYLEGYYLMPNAYRTRNAVIGVSNAPGAAVVPDMFSPPDVVEGGALPGGPAG
ncbi:hypothetical protein [Streptomyces sp. NPDC053755]|uniref:hypothetical protein n=1 Tax=Streptomyces sp. NPDC053755 TaxID=3155815 RepID=UPI00342358E4